MSTITGTLFSDEIDTLGVSMGVVGGAATNGDDTISGLGGSDTLRGGSGNDLLDGGTDPDVLWGDLGDDTLLGGDGADYLIGGPGNDWLDGGLGNDSLYDPDGVNTLLGGGGNDILSGAGTLDGGIGDDTITATSIASVVTGGAGRDTFKLVNDGQSTNGVYVITDFTAGANGDRLDLSFWLSSFSTTGYDGLNPFTGGYVGVRQDGADTVIRWDGTGGGDGYFDAVRLKGVLLTSLTADNFNPGYSPGSTITGTPFADILNSGAGSDSLVGYGGDDTLFGNAGDDTLDGGDGNDFLDGGDGNDLLDGGVGYDTVNLSGSGYRSGTFTQQANGDVTFARPDQIDTLRNVEEMSFIDGRLAFGVNDAAAQVSRLYLAALGRGAEQGGLNGWVGLLRAGTPLAALGDGFLGSSEFAARYGLPDNGRFVDLLYQNVLGRAADPAGRAGWVGALDGGASRSSVLIGFSESDEHKGRTASLQAAGIWDRDETAAQVARLYDTEFGRLPDLAGLTGWKDSLTSGALSLNQVADAFSASSEFQAIYGALNTTDFVRTLYLNALHRPGEQAGLDGWVNAINSGQITRSGAVLGFSESAEHQQLSAANVGGETSGTFGIKFAG